MSATNWHFVLEAREEENLLLRLLSLGLLSLLLGLLGLVLTFLLGLLFRKKYLVDVGENTASSDGHTAHKLVEFLIVANGQLDVAGDDALALVVGGSVSSELKKLSDHVLEYRGHVHGGTGTNALSNTHVLHETVDTTNGEHQVGLLRTAHGLLAVTAPSFSFSRHFKVKIKIKSNYKNFEFWDQAG